MRILDELFTVYGPPTCIRSDNGPEFIVQALRKWLAARHVGVHYIDPGKSMAKCIKREFQRGVW